LPSETTSTVSGRVAAARRAAFERSGCINAQLPGPEVQRVAPMCPEAGRLLERWVRSGSLSARGLDRIRRLALTIADLAAISRGCIGDGEPSSLPGAAAIEVEQLQQALLLRCQREYLLGGAR
jgi:magnesium chelatase family protein